MARVSVALEVQCKISSSMVMWKFSVGNLAPLPATTFKVVAVEVISAARVLSARFLTFKKADMLFFFEIQLKLKLSDQN